MSFFRRLLARREFPLPQFDLQPLAFELGSVGDDELLLDRIVQPSEEHWNVISLGQPLPTAGELRESIERHLQASKDSPADQAASDPAAELREALSDLRSALR
jgi:hypothetical protein